MQFAKFYAPEKILLSAPLFKTRKFKFGIKEIEVMIINNNQ